MAELTNVGDAIRGEKVIAKARAVGRPQLIQFSGRHKGSQIVLRDTVYCVISIPLKGIANKRESS
jgi:hypothetical protein